MSKMTLNAAQPHHLWEGGPPGGLLFVDGEFPTFTSGQIFLLLCAGDSLLRNLIMPADSLSNDMAALLRVLEEVERSTDERPLANVAKFIELHEEAGAEPGKATYSARNSNPFVETIDAAMQKLRSRSPARFIG